MLGIAFGKSMPLHNFVVTAAEYGVVSGRISLAEGKSSL
jgi:hypothetical protein